MMKAIKQHAIASAPGRLDVMGGIADYSGSLLLQKAIKAQTTVEITLHETSEITITSGSSTVQFDYKSFLNASKGEIYKELWAYFHRNPQDEWAGYVVGCFFVLQREKGIELSGAQVNVNSEVPIGKGVSSSAALEVATMKALQELYGVEFKSTELSILAQKVENSVVGAPCGLMDQLACYYGSVDSLLPIVCQPANLFDNVSIPTDVHFIGIDSGVKHAVSGASYGDVRIAAAMGYSIIAQSMGISVSQLESARITQHKAGLPFDGYISNCTVSSFEKEYRHLLPIKLSGADFIEKYNTTIDNQVQVNPLTIYQVQACTQHPIYENFRVNTFQSILQSINTQASAKPSQLEILGELMYQSHASYSACGLGEKQTDTIVALAKKQKSNGIYGAKITGGGSGGTVCLLAYGVQGLEAAQELYEEYQEILGSKVMWIE